MRCSGSVHDERPPCINSPLSGGSSASVHGVAEEYILKNGLRAVRVDPAPLETEVAQPVSIENGPMDVEGNPRVIVLSKAGKRRRTENARSEALGSNLKEMIFQIRSGLEERFLIFVSSKKSIRRLQLPGACHRLPAMDYLRCTEHGAGFPACVGIRWCVSSVPGLVLMIT